MIHGGAMKYVPFAIALLGAILVIVLQFFPLGGPRKVVLVVPMNGSEQALAQKRALLEEELQRLNSSIATASLQNRNPQQLEEQKKKLEDALAKLSESQNFNSDPTTNLAVAVATKPDNTTHVMQIGISVLVLASGLWVILSKLYQPAVLHWAYGAVGTIIGFWLKG
jgi:hypothetical protein